MPTTQLNVNQEAIFTVLAQGADGSSKPAGFSAQIAPYSVAYVAAAPGGSGNLHVVGKAAGTASLAITGHSIDGTALPNQVLSFQVNALPVPQATQLVLGSIAVSDKSIATPADPGTDTVTGNL